MESARNCIISHVFSSVAAVLLLCVTWCEVLSVHMWRAEGFKVVLRLCYNASADKEGQPHEMIMCFNLLPTFTVVTMISSFAYGLSVPIAVHDALYARWGMQGLWRTCFVLHSVFQYDNT